MQAILYIGHGSRVKEAAEEAVQFMKQTMELVDVPIQEYCFLELCEPDILKGVRQCVDQGATKIAVVPVLLLTAGHAKKDIPEELDMAKKKYPDISFTYGRPLGIHEKIIDILVEKVKERTSVSAETNILLVGRGSSDKEQIQDIQTIARQLKDRIPVKSVETCFLAAATPRLPQKTEEMAKEGAQHVVILPYLLFTGILMKEILKTVAELELLSNQRFEVCDYIGDHPNLYYLLKERALQAAELKACNNKTMSTAGLELYL